MEICNSHHTPLPLGIMLINNMSPKNKAERTLIEDKPYCQLLGALTWAQAATRPNLSFTVAILACFQSSPSSLHWKALLHVLAYIKGTLDYQITYSKDMLMQTNRHLVINLGIYLPDGRRAGLLELQKVADSSSIDY